MILMRVLPNLSGLRRRVGEGKSASLIEGLVSAIFKIFMLEDDLRYVNDRKSMLI